MLKNARQADTGVKLEVNERYEGVLCCTIYDCSRPELRDAEVQGDFALGSCGKVSPAPPPQPFDDSVSVTPA